jgi:hypothetical protein
VIGRFFNGTLELDGVRKGLLMQAQVYALLTVLVLSGCAGEPDNAKWRGELEVSGVVKLDGIPLAGATVSFHQATGSPLVATTDQDGNYALDLTEIEGSALGKYSVRIRRSSKLNVEGSSEMVEDVPEKFNEQTELVRDIFDGAISIDFNLITEAEEDEPGE